MDVYVGQTRSSALIERLREEGIGECTCRGELPPRRAPWFLDNGAYRDWKDGRNKGCQAWYGTAEFMQSLIRIRADCRARRYPWPRFVVVPDRVGVGNASLEESASWVSWIRNSLLFARLYLVVQDGMTADAVRGAVEEHGYDGLFIGGTSDWKRETAPRWVLVARQLRIRCHLGRAGTPQMVRLAKQLGVDSIDSSLPLWSKRHLRRFLEALREPDTTEANEQRPLFATRQ